MEYLHYMTTPESEALDRLLQVVVVLGAVMTQHLAKEGLTDARAHLLWELQRSGPTTQRALAEAMKVSPRNVTGLLDGLVVAGFVTRQPHPTDRRASLVTFTERGARTARELAAGQQQLARQLFSAMPPERLGCFVAGLDDVLVGLEKAARGDG